MAGTLTAREVFGFLLPEQVNAISEAAERINCKSGETVYEKGDKAEHFFVVLDGEITLRLPGKGGINLVIDQLHQGAVFGGCIGCARPAYSLSAQCTSDAILLRIRNSALKTLMERDPKLGYHLQGYISNAYFSRYIDTMQKLQAIVMNIPVEA
jgi:CRP/FNR family transcriptional regulator, dissimilatory nitrate respiration regulator